MENYILNKTIETPGAIVRVYSPVLEPEQKAARLKRIHKAAADLIKAAQIKK